LFSINPIFGLVFAIAVVIFLKKNPKVFTSLFTDYLKAAADASVKASKAGGDARNREIQIQQFFGKTGLSNLPSKFPGNLLGRVKLEKRKKYLQIALNSTLEEAGEIISQLPASDRILIEAGTPLIKIYGTAAVSQIKKMAPVGAYIVADNKCADLATREVELMANAGANASTCLGVAPIETINGFIDECDKLQIDSIVDMMNVPDVLAVLKKLKKLPTVVMLHRGVDESEFSKEKQIPYYQIKQIKGNYKVLVGVAGGDTAREVQRTVFNGADIVVVWKNFYTPSSETAKLAKSFLEDIKNR
jgi:3-keto-L-gulonate-6-phosphate decarboxylase